MEIQRRVIKGRCKVREVGTFLGQEVETLVTGLDAGVCKRAQAARLNSRWIGVFFSCTTVKTKINEKCARRSN